MRDECPICQNPVKGVLERDYGDKKQVDCPRCGKYEVSGTALSMLNSRLNHDKLARARLSHAIRLNSLIEGYFFVSSANLDELVRQPLPSIPQQLHFLLSWFAAQLGDDRLGSIPHSWPEELAAIVGAASGDRVERLIEYAVSEGFIEQHDKDAVSLSPKGWALVENLKNEELATSAPTQPVSAEFFKAHCNKCAGERNAYNRGSYSVGGNDGETSWSDGYEILECCGCNGLSVRRTFWFSEWDSLDHDPITGEPRRTPGTKTSYWPPQTNRTKPSWLQELSDEPLRRAMDEVFQALDYGLIVLASIGTRTLLDRAMLLRVGDPRGGFGAKLDKMVENGHIGLDERKILEAITDAGSAAAHRGFAPSPKTLNTIMSTVENFLHREFVLKTAAGDVRTATPPRK